MDQIPKKFPEYFKKLISKLSSQTINCQDADFKSIYENIVNSQEQDFTIQSTLAQLQMSQPQQIKHVQKEFLIMKSLYKKFDNLVEKLENTGVDVNLSIQEQDEIKFQIFYQKDSFNIDKIINILEQEQCVYINDMPAFKLMLKTQFLSLQQDQSLKDQIEIFLQKDQQSFCKNSEKQKQNIIDIIFSRKNALNILTSKLSFINPKMMLDSINCLYESDQTPEEEKQETLEQFQVRVDKILIQECKQYEKFKKNNLSKIQVLIKQLFQQAKILNLTAIKEALKNSRIKDYSDVNKISNDLLVKIYKLSSIQSFQNATNNEQIPKIRPINPQILPKKVPQKKTQNQKFSQTKKLIQNINYQIRIVQSQVGKNQCFEVILRKLQIAAIEGNSKIFQNLCNNLEQMLAKYGFDENIKYMKEMKSPHATNEKRLIEVTHFKGSILALNLVQIIQAKKSIENSKQCLDADAIIILGITGAGKSTFMVGGSGYQIGYNSQTLDYRAVKPQIAQKYVVSNKMVSQTRKPNVSEINKDWTKQLKIILIDTPGLGQNRNSQIDITNNISTVSMLSKLKSARIVIALAKHQFQGRCFQPIKLMIRNISNYINNFEKLKKSTVFIFSKGLTFDVVKKNLIQFNKLQQTKKQKWTSNQIIFRQFLTKKFIDNNENDSQDDNDLFQILDPSKHNYKDLIAKILKKKPTNLPGQYISASFTQPTMINLKQMSIYLQKMVYKTFNLRQFTSTKYYLSQIKDLQTIQSSNTLHNKIQISLKNQLQEKLKMTDVWFKKFYDNNSQQYIQNIKEVRNFFENIQQSQFLIKLLYKQGQNTPLKKLKNSIVNNLKQPLSQLERASQIEKDKRIHAFSSLKLIKQFMSKSEYQNIKAKIENNNQDIEKQINKILNSTKSNQGGWQNNVKDYINQFRLDGVVVSDIQNYQNLNKIIKKYLESKPKQQTLILNLLDVTAKKQTLDGQLFSVCDIFLGKLQMLKQTHFVVKDAVQPKFNQIINLLETANVYLKNQKDKVLQNLDLKSVQYIQVYEKNSKQIFDILINFSKSPATQFKVVKEEQSTLNKIKQKLYQNIEKFQKSIDQLILRPQNIDPPLLNQYLKIIFGLIYFIRNTKSASEKSKIKNSNHTDILSETMKQSEQSLQRIKRKIQRTSNNTNIQNYEINYRLILCLLVTKQYAVFYSKYFQNSQNSEHTLGELAKTIQAKLKRPYTQIQVSKIPFKKHFFQKLTKVLRYMKLLDKKSIQYGDQANSFSFTINFTQNQDLKKILQKTYLNVINQFEKLKCIKELIKYQQKKDLIFDNTQLNSNQQHLNSLSYVLCQIAANYILCYDQIIMISQEFSTIPIVKTFNEQNIEKLNFEKLIYERLYNIDSQMSDPLRVQGLDRKNLLNLNKQFKFHYQIFRKAQKKSIVEQFNETQNKIYCLIQKISQDFDSQLKNVQQNSKSVRSGFDFGTLKNLLNLQDVKNQKNKKRISLLFNSINNQYNQLMSQIFVNFDLKGDVTQNTNIYLNINEFLKIAEKQTQRNVIDKNIANITINTVLLEQNCQNFFLQLKNSFDVIINGLNYGIPYQHNKIIYLTKFQRRINLCLNVQYKKFLKQNNIQESLEKWLDTQMKNIIKKIQQQYLSNNPSYDQNYKRIYFNTTPQNKQKMKTIAIQNNKKTEKQLSDLLKDNHENLQKLLDKTSVFVEMMPSDIGQCVKNTIQNIKKQKQKIQVVVSGNLQKALLNNNPKDLLLEMKKGIQLNSNKIKDIVQMSIQKYYEEQTKKFKFQDLQKVRNLLNKQKNFYNDLLFKQISQNDPFLNKIHCNFINIIKHQLHHQINQNHKQFLIFKKQLIQRNSEQSFKIYQFKTSTINLNPIIELLKLSSQFVQVFQKQNKQIKQMIEKQITSLNYQLKSSNEKLQIYRLNFLIKNEIINKSEFISILKKTIVHKQACSQYKAFDKIPIIQVKIQNKQIQATNQIINSMKSSLRDILMMAQNWKVQEALTNDTIERITIRNQQIQYNISLLDNFTQIFFTKNQMPERVLQHIQNLKQRQVRRFQQKVIDEINLSFQSQQQIGTQRCIKFYILQNLMRKNHLKVFPPNMKLNPSIKQILKQKFKQSTKKIQQFSEDNTKIDIFNRFLKNYQNVTIQQTRKLENKKYQIEENKQIFLISNKSDLQTKLRTVSSQDQQKEDKIMRINKQLETDKIARLNDFANELKDSEHQIKQWGRIQREKLSNLNYQFLKKQIALNLIINRRVRTNFSCQQEILNYPVKISSLINRIEANYSKKFIRCLYNCLVQYESPYSHTLVSQENIFSVFTKQFFSDQAKGKTFNQILNQMPQITHESKQILISKCKYYNEKYNQICTSYQNANEPIQVFNSIINQTKRLGQQLKKQYQCDKQTIVQRQQLLAYIFAIWTISKAEKDEMGNIIYSYKPHDGQLVAVFLLLQMYNQTPTKQIQKAMIQISTGEGKSVILAALSSYLALVGFEVYEACYSSYLSSRDYKDFENLFINLGIQGKIKYDIFPQICKMMLNQSTEDKFINKIHQLIMKPSLWEDIKNIFKSCIHAIMPQDKKKCVLLIDQADVFIDEKYIGQTYLPSINIKTKSIKDLLDFVWGKRQLGPGFLKPQIITESKQFKKVISQINNKTFKSIMQNQTNAMIRDLFNFKNDTYSVIKDKIYYKEGDGLSDKIHYGYRTIFAYYHQCLITQRITTNELNNQAVINLMVAAFSYAQLPAYFKTILGVTGTIEAMSVSQREILQDKFGVKKIFIQPSIYPQSNRIIKFKNCFNNKLYSQIVKDIQNQREKNRPTVVFFNTKSETYEFFQSDQFQKFRSIASIITYEVKQKDRDYRINVSTQQKKITLSTYDFSRGTDFKLKVKDPKSHPGLHVISACQPSSFSDYIQLTGRTARQGKNGSVTIYIVQESQVPNDKIYLSQKEAQEKIRQNDNNRWKMIKNQINQKIEKANKQHVQYVNLYSSVSTINTIFQSIKTLNYQLPLTVHKSKTAICIDATSSMGAAFKKVIQVTQGAIPNIYKAIQKSNVVGSFEIKFVIYRNYNSIHEHILQYTNFESKQTNLVKWLNKITVSGGWGNQALQVCLEHLNSIKQLNQFIIISDAKANTNDQTVFRRNDKGQKYWIQNGFKLTNYEQQLNQLIIKNIKGHSYYLNASYTKDFYDDLSKRTGGQSKQFDINAKKATGQFADFVAGKIIKNLGQLIGGDAGARMAQNYQKIKIRYK